MLISGRHIMMIPAWSPGVTSHITHHITITSDLTRGDHCFTGHWSPPSTIQESLTASSSPWTDLSSRSSHPDPPPGWHIVIIRAGHPPLPDHRNHRVISPRNCAILPAHSPSPAWACRISIIQYLPTMANVCRAELHPRHVLVYSLNVVRTAFSAYSWWLVTLSLFNSLIPSLLSVLFVLGPQNANDIRYNWSICIELEW